jgi:hypothetical protein
MSRANVKKNGVGGRPPKFDEPSRPVTMTLPLRTLDLLETLGPDRARAIVRFVDIASNEMQSTAQLVDMVPISEGSSLLVVPENRSLRQFSWLKMIEVAAGRYLLAVDTGTPIERIELALTDLIDNVRTTEPAEVTMLQDLLDKFRRIRRTGAITTTEIFLLTVNE